MLIHLVASLGRSNWKTIANLIKTKNARQCKDRWTKYLSPSVANRQWNRSEDDKLIQLFGEIGPKWVQISKLFDGRTDVQLKNRFKVLQRRGYMHPMTENHSFKEECKSKDNIAADSNKICCKEEDNTEAYICGLFDQTEEFYNEFCFIDNEN